MTLNRRQVASLPLALSPLAAGTAAAASGNGADLKILRYAFLIAETTFDPAQISDLYSRTVVAGMLEAPLEFEFYAKPTRMRPNTAAEMPQISDDYKTFTFRIKPGIFFADDPAFGASWWRRTTCTPSSATTTRAGRAPTSTSSRTPRSSA
jgi:ABC-type transport system substrate-binding protein